MSGNSVTELKRLAEELADNDDLRRSMSGAGQRAGRSHVLARCGGSADRRSLTGDPTPSERLNEDSLR